jgi:flagellar protein FlaF
MITMSFSVNGSYLIIGLAIFTAFATMFPAVSNTTGDVTNGFQKQFERSENIADTGISIVGSGYDFASGTLSLRIKNTGKTSLSIKNTDLLVDGVYVINESRSTTLSGDRGTDLWTPGETLTITVDTRTPDRAKVVTEHGVAAFAEIDVFRLTRDVAFTSNGDARSIGPTGSITTYNQSVQVLGPPVAEFVNENTGELPAVDTGGTVFVVTEAGDRTDLASNARASASRLTAGRWQGSDGSVFFVDSQTRNLVRVTAGGDTTVIETNASEGVAGISDFDGDGADELIYGGESPSGSSSEVNYVDDDGSLVGTGIGYGTDSGIGLGEPGDFDDDGTVRVPIVDGSNNIQLVSSSGATTALTSNNQVAKAPLGTADLDRDTEQEIYHVTENSELRFIDNVTTQNDAKLVTDDQGNPISADKDTGVT